MDHLNEIDFLKARLEELTEALALTNEIVKRMVESSPENKQNNWDGVWVKLGIKKIEDMTPSEIAELNEKVSRKYSGTTAKSENAIKQPTFATTLRNYDTGYEGDPYSFGIDSVLKKIINQWIYELQHPEEEKQLTKLETVSVELDLPLEIEDHTAEFLNLLSEETAKALSSRKLEQSATPKYMVKYFARSVGLGTIKEAMQIMASDIESVHKKYGIIGALTICGGMKLSIDPTSKPAYTVYCWPGIPNERSDEFDEDFFATSYKEG